MRVRLTQRLEKLKKTPRSRLPRTVDRQKVYYVDGKGSMLCPDCANTICSEFVKDVDNPRDLPIEHHIMWFTEHHCSCCDDLIKGEFNE